MPADPNENWQAFIDEHPELSKSSMLKFADDDLIPALRAAIERRRQWALEWPKRDRLRERAHAWASDVAQQLTERPTRSDVLKVDAGLRRLEKRGLMLVERPRHSSNRYRLPPAVAA